MKLNLKYYSRSVESYRHAKLKILRQKYGWAGDGRFWALNDIIGSKDHCILFLDTKRDKQFVAGELEMKIPELDAFIAFLVHEDCELLMEVEGGGYTTEKLQDSLGVTMKNREFQRARKRKVKGSDGDAEEPNKEPNKDLADDQISPLNGGKPDFHSGKEDFHSGEGLNKGGKATDYTILYNTKSPTDSVEQGSTVVPPTLEEVYRNIKSANCSAEEMRNLIYKFIKKNRPQFIEPYADLWNIFAEKYNKAKVSRLTEKRRKKLKARLKEAKFDISLILVEAKDCKLLRTKSWFSFDFIINSESNYLKVIEGNYRDDVQEPKPTNEVDERFEKALKRA